MFMRREFICQVMLVHETIGGYFEHNEGYSCNDNNLNNVRMHLLEKPRGISQYLEQKRLNLP